MSSSSIRGFHGSVDDVAFRDYVLARGTTLLRIAVMLTGNRADAEDLVQATLVNTYQAWDKINDRPPSTPTCGGR